MFRAPRPRGALGIFISPAGRELMRRTTRQAIMSAGALVAVAAALAAASAAGREDETLPRIRAVPGYVERFRKVFGPDDFDIDHVAKAIATFERTVLSGNSPYDRYQAGEKRAMTEAQVRGMDVFFKKAACDACHLGF